MCHRERNAIGKVAVTNRPVYSQMSDRDSTDKQSNLSNYDIIGLFQHIYGSISRQKANTQVDLWMFLFECVCLNQTAQTAAESDRTPGSPPPTRHGYHPFVK